MICSHSVQLDSLIKGVQNEAVVGLSLVQLHRVETIGYSVL